MIDGGFPFQLIMTRAESLPSSFFFGKVIARESGAFCWHHARLDWAFSADHFLSHALISERSVICTFLQKTSHHARVNPPKKAVRCLRYRVTSTAMAAPVSIAPTRGSRRAKTQSAHCANSLLNYTKKPVARLPLQLFHMYPQEHISRLSRSDVC